MPDEDEFRELCGDVMEMVVTVGMVDSVSERWPDDVQESWAERVQMIRKSLQQHTEEVHQFATSYDH